MNFQSNYSNAMHKINFVHKKHAKITFKRARTNKKAHIAHSSIPIALLDYPFSILEIDGEDRGYLIESTIANNLDKTSFWRTAQKHEVDIIVQNKTILPIEVKYRSSIRKKDIKGLLKFLERFDLNKGIVITKDILKNELIDNKEILYIPAWLFLLLSH